MDIGTADGRVTGATGGVELEVNGEDMGMVESLELERPLEPALPEDLSLVATLSTGNRRAGVLASGVLVRGEGANGEANGFAWGVVWGGRPPLVARGNVGNAESVVSEIASPSDGC